MLPEIQIRAHNTGILDILRHRAKCQINSHLYSGSKVTGFFCDPHRFSLNEECKIWCCLSPKTFCIINTRATIFDAETFSQSASELVEAKSTPQLKQSEEELAVSHLHITSFVLYSRNYQCVWILYILAMLSREKILRIHSAIMVPSQGSSCPRLDLFWHINSAKKTTN